MHCINTFREYMLLEFSGTFYIEKGVTGPTAFASLYGMRKNIKF